MTIMFCIIVVLACFQSFVHSESSVGQISNSTTLFGPLIENILRLERAVTNMSWELKLTKANLETTKSDLATTKQNWASVIHQKLEEITNLTETLVSDSNREISFQVRQIKRPYSPGPFEPLKFDDVTLNKGGAYNPTSGIFTVPKTGTYLCWANILAHRNDRFRLALMKEGKEIVRGYPATASFTYLLTLSKGEHVWFTVYDGYLNIAGEIFSSYGCHLM